MEIKIKSSDYSKKISWNDAVKNLFDFNIGSALTDIVKIKHSKESKAFLLLFISIRETNLILAKKYGQEQLTSRFDLVLVTKNFQAEVKDLLESDVVLKQYFFEDITKFDKDFLRKSLITFHKFCDEISIELPLNFQFEYYETFFKSLNAEFNSRQDFYIELKTFFSNGLNNGLEKIDKLLSYYKIWSSYFTNRIQTNIEEIKETLEDLYIEPNFLISERNVVRVDEKDIYKDFLQISEVNIHQFINNYFFDEKVLENVKQHHNMMFLLGQPGQGKTSLCYKIVHDYLLQNHFIPETPIYFIKIRELSIEDFVKQPLETICKKLDNLLNFETDKAILLLDGLDEAHMSGGINENSLRGLYERLKRNSKNVKIILTSRTGYILSDDYCLDNTLVVKLEEFSDLQIRSYSNKFIKFYPDNIFHKEIESILIDNQYSHVKEMLRQAVLIYFVSIANIDIKNNDSKAMIFEKIFESMSSRSWDKNGQLDYIKPKLKENPHLYKKYLREYIKNIAFEIHQSPNLFITVSTLRSLESTKAFIEKCFNEDIFADQEKINDVNKYLLISFYFQENSKKDSSDTAIEFFHNSLWEYLTAEYIWEQNRSFLAKVDEDNELLKVDFEDYFNLLSRLVGNKTLDYTIRYNLSEIISNEDIDIKEIIKTQIDKVFYKLQDKSFLLVFNYKLEKLNSQQKKIEIFKLIWRFYTECNYDGEKMIVINEDLCDLIFLEAYMCMDESFCNLKFEDDGFLPRYIEQCEFQNCEFFIGMYNYSVNHTTFRNVIFNKVDICDSIFRFCTFYNCTFINSEFIKTFTISDNKFFNCKFINIIIPQDNNYFNKLKESNIFDADTLESLVVADFVITSKHSKSNNFVINYIEELNEIIDIKS